MSETTQAVETPAAPKPISRPKKTSPKATKTDKPKSTLRKPQIAILTALSRNKHPLTRPQIAEKAKTDQAFLSTWIGAHDPAVRKANEAKRGIKGLLTLGFVRFANSEEANAVVYEITAAGRAALAKVAE